MINALESVHSHEVGETGIRSSTRQNGGDVDVSESPDDMDVFEFTVIWMFLMIVN